jgi:iron complex transport system ATP-binding protein
MLSAEGLCFHRGERVILDQVDLELGRGEMLGLIGPNGAGKSTLLRLLAGVLTPTVGSLTLDGRAIDHMTRRERARRIAYLPQLNQIAWPLSVERLVELGRLPHLEPWQHPGPDDRAIIERVIVQTDLLALRQRPFDTLSGGEQARVLLARALVTEPDVLLADEPVAALDPAHQLDVMQLLSDHCEAGQSVIVVLHDLTLAAHYCDRLQLLLEGATLADGLPDEVLNDENLADAYAIEVTEPVVSAFAPFYLPWRRLRESD